MAVQASSDGAPAAFANSQLSERDSLKTQLIRATANSQRGKKATQTQQEAILQAAKSLEALNPTDSPATSPLINGRWSLLYQGPEEATKRGEPLEGPVIDFFRPILGFLFRTLGVYQVIDTSAGAVDNLVEFSFASAVRGSLNVGGTVAPAEATAAGGPVTRVDVRFTAFRLQLGWLAFSLPLGWADPKGWVETTYVDDSFRIGHGDKGSIFITSKAARQAQ
jgi:hypothetical protein